MTLTHFGLYLIPESGEFYRKGSEIVGYDIRNERTLSPRPFIDPEWNSTNREYGWHITITDAIEIEKDKLPLVIETVRGLLSCLREDNVYSLAKYSLGFWPETSQQIAMRLTPNRNVELLHDVLTAVIHPMGQGSVYYDRYKADKKHYFQDDSYSRIAKTEHFYSPYIFDQFTPHFTCIHPFTGTNEERVVLLNELNNLFMDTHELQFRTLAMVAKDESDSFYRIINEFDLQGGDR